jgi:predicted ribonuclease YlaK
LKTYVLDTSVIIHDPDCFFKFEDNKIVIPYVVLQELDGLKNAPGEKGYAARKAQKNIERLFLEGSTNHTIHRHHPSYEGGSNDQYIVDAARYDRILVSRDVGMRILAHTQDIAVEDYENTQVKEVYNGYKIVQVDDPWYIDRLYGGQPVEVQELGISAVENEYVVLQCGDSKSVLSVCKQGELHVIQTSGAYGLVARNLEQRLALHALLDENIKLVTLTGNAGSGKTLLALAAALEYRRNYHQVVLTRPIVALSNKDLGFLPGPQPLDAKVLTDNGWSTMGEISVGSNVISASTGRACRVLGVYPKGVKPVYRITTLNGTVECCMDHLWLTKTAEELKLNRDGCIRSTADIHNTIHHNHIIPTFTPDRSLWYNVTPIIAIDYVENKEVQCILIDDPSHLYVTDDYLVTHNTLTDKVDPYNGPFNDNLAVLRELRESNAKDIDNMRQTEKIKVEAMPYIRGRSFNKIMLISDECQNMTRHEIKTLVTRVGDGTKLVLTGDINQIDIAGMDEYSNGLSHLISRMKGQPMFAHITLAKSERSPLAELAARVL